MKSLWKFTAVLFLSSAVMVMLSVGAYTASIFDRSQIPWPYIDVMAYPYFAKCDGIAGALGGTDDFVALQNAGNDAIASGEAMMLPAGRVCNFGTGLTYTFLSAKTLAPSISIIGQAGSGISPRLQYTGTGDAITITSGVGGQQIYNVTLKNFQLWGALAAPAGRAINCVLCNQPVLENLQIFGLQNISTQTWGFTTAFDMTSAAGLQARNVGWNDVNVGMKLVNAVDVNVQGGFTFGANIDYQMGGNMIGIWIVNGVNYEGQNIFMDWDESLTPATLDEAFNVHVENNYLLFGLFPSGPNQALRVNNIGTNELLLQNIIFKGNNIYCPAPSCASASQPFNLSASGTSAFVTVSLTLEGNWIFGWPVGAVTGNNLGIQPTLINNQDLQTNFLPQLQDVYGTTSPILSRYLWWANGAQANVLQQGPVAETNVVKEVTTNYTATLYDSLILASGVAPTTITIPVGLGSPTSSPRWDVIDTGTHTVTVVCSSGQMNNNSGVALSPGSSPGNGYTFWTDGTNCWAH